MCVDKFCKDVEEGQHVRHIVTHLLQDLNKQQQQQQQAQLMVGEPGLARRSQ